MVKFAEAEKRRGGDGSDRRYAPVMMLERPKMSRGMWESLKGHIMRERRRKKEELEANEEEKRMRKERENRKKQHAMTLEETREQRLKEEQKLNDLRTQKLDVVQQLKKVWTEETRRKDQEALQQHQQHQQHHYAKESDIVPVHAYNHSSLPIGSHPPMMFPSGIGPARPSIQTLYKVGPPAQPIQSLMGPSASAHKRPRSPSPPPPSAYPPLSYGFKPGQGQAVPVTLTTSKTGGTNVYLSNAPFFQPTQPAQSGYHSGPQTSQAAVVSPYLTTPSVPPLSQPPQREEKHLQSVYIPGPRGHVNALHPQPSKPPPTFGAPDSDKFYVRPHLLLHASMPVQNVQPGGLKSNSITGFPVRGPPTSSQNTHTIPISSAHSYNLGRNCY